MKVNKFSQCYFMKYFKFFTLIFFLHSFLNLFCMEDQAPISLKVCLLKAKENNYFSIELTPSCIGDEYLSMLLYGAALKGRIEVVSEILKSKNVDVNYHGDVTGNTPLIAAIENKHCDIAILLLNHPDIDIDRSNFKGITPILVAVNDENMLRVFKNLFDRGANLRACYENGDNILHQATAKQNLEYVKLIVSKYPELINQMGEHRISPMDWVKVMVYDKNLKPGFEELVDLLKEAASKQI